VLTSWSETSPHEPREVSLGVSPSRGGLHPGAPQFSQGFEVSAAIMVLALVVGAIMIRVSRQDLTGAQP
jgi:hypothetical protein